MKDEPSITLPAVRIIAVTFAACAVAAGAWAGGAAVLGYGGTVVLGGPVGAALTAVIASIVFILTMPWMAKPTSTTMLLWLASDMLAMVMTLGVAYLLYSATFLGPDSGPPLLLGVVLAFFLVLLAKVAVAASHLKTLGLM
jgi:hypothetical protein